MMDPKYSERVETIFAQAVDLAEPERAAFLAEACGDDESLRVHVEKLLVVEARMGGFMEEPTVKLDASPFPEVATPGTTVGRYKLLQKIGEGGFGDVYMAEQQEPVVRKVALKIIKLGMDTHQVIARFEAERQALALMDHPNIAKVLDGGTTGEGESEISSLPSQAPAGRPYFVMELVNGIPITHFCDANRLCVEERLRLFLDVCSAIQHAHQKGIIYRDLKPTNVLVTMNGDRPLPKVIDFGIAKATQGRLTDKTLFTRFQQFIGTPAYMSPEQAQMSAVDVDTRSDIYSLGVLLYELMTGSTPFDSKELMQSGLDEMRRMIQEREPVRPSTRVRQIQHTTAGFRPHGRHAVFASDLDWIILKAMEKDRTRRYETANGLAADIRRFLNQEPGTAAAPCPWYAFQKFAQRSKVAFAAGLAIRAALILTVHLSLKFQSSRLGNPTCAP